MAEYINKEQLLSHLFNKQDEPLDVMKEIAEFHAADVAEVRRGRWIEDYPDVYCSCCQKTWFNARTDNHPSEFYYCPHCGADMREVAHESPQI